MSLASISIRRPVLAIVMSLLIVIFGIIGATFLGVREYPNVDPPIITVSVSYVGANADIVETQITEPLEESINGIAGIKSLTSTSRDGRSNITVEFDLSIDLEGAANDVRDRVARAVNNLPPDADPPVVAKADADANPIVFLNIKSDAKGLLELSDIANKIFKERLQTIPGVSQVQIWGEKRYSMKLWLDPAKLASFKLTPLDVANAINSENIELPSGRLDGASTELVIRTLGLLKTTDDFENLIVKEINGRVIRFRDLGYAELGPENERTLLRRDGVPMVGVVLIPQPGSNHIQIVDEFYKRVDQIKKDLPDDIELGIGFDVTKFIRSSISEVQETIFIAFMLVVMIIFFFLRDWGSTIIPIIVIPISLIGTFFIMYLADFSINVLTLLGMVLAIGIVVDDAIVVLENIYKKIENGMNSIEAGIEGTKEIFFAVISTTAALVSVFLPLIFLQGLTGRLFREFAFVIMGAVVISSFIALTLTPMLSTRFLSNKKGHGKFYHLTEPFFENLTSYYKSSLEKFMNKRYLAFPIVLTAFILIYYFGSTIPNELAPYEDRSGLRVQVTGPEGANFEFMDNYMNELSAMVSELVPEADAIVAITSPGFGGASTTNSGFLRIRLVDPQFRKRSQQEIYNELSTKLNKLNDARAIVIQEQSVSSRGRGLPVQYVIQAPTMEKLKKVIPDFLEKARSSSVFLVSEVNLRFTKPEVIVEIDRDKAKNLGISIMDVTRTLQFAFSGRRFGYFIMDGKQYQVIGQVDRYNRSGPVNLTSIYVRNSKGDLVQLDNIVSLRESSNPPQLYRFNRYVSATISAALAPGKTMGQGIDEMDRIADEVLDETFSTALDGASKDFKESSANLYFIFILALILIYLVLSAQFESFRSPFVIMFTVPLALAGALFSLWFFDQTMNIFSQIGQVMLIGLVTKNGILIVEFANQRREKGLAITEAVIDAAVSRLRPILMTSLSTILGILPIALALGAGSESRVSMGIAVIGGLVLSTFLTLFIIPAFYSYVAKK
ncbi:MAG: efflux RND transporter permease subunit [Ignavibacteriaceae bacterium]|nr:efflux RND transporter permease subunit [Ignavibacteriaceae bacterium]